MQDSLAGIFFYEIFKYGGLTVVVLACGYMWACKRENKSFCRRLNAVTTVFIYRRCASSSDRRTMSFERKWKRIIISGIETWSSWGNTFCFALFCFYWAVKLSELHRTLLLIGMLSLLLGKRAQHSDIDSLIEAVGLVGPSQRTRLPRQGLCPATLSFSFSCVCQAGESET